MIKRFKERFREEVETLYYREIIHGFILPDGSVDLENPKRIKSCDKAVYETVSIVKEIIDAL
ncbi:MAG: C_GCAxxG_C_C family protein [Candidatus Heimdallarchaeota archaeon]|nr:C_GCAxxG_C_C family protein [Candidatus Heimdallarchaeota archaeon]